MIQLIDSHAHLDMLADAQAAMDRANQAGVIQVVTIGVDLASSQKAAALAASMPGVHFTVGLHPHDAQCLGSHNGSGEAVATPDSAGSRSDAFWLRMEALARSGAVAIGECGLDYYRDLSPRPLQAQAFARQIDLAKKLGLPLVVHDREAHADVVAMLKEHQAGEVGGVVHCFSGDPALARQVLDLGFHLGIDGPITYSGARVLREVASLVPLESILLETDCPFLTPLPMKGKNEPAYLTHTCERLAQVTGRPMAEVAAVTTANTRRLFRLPEAPGV